MSSGGPGAAFEKVEPAKRERILNAALAEFARKPYADASTNSIVAAAGISKGILFHYFGSKKNLYLYLFNYVGETLEKEIYSSLSFEGNDLPALLRQIGRVKLQVLKRHPNMSDFALRCVKECPPETRPELAAMIAEQSAKRLDKFVFDNLDVGRFAHGFRSAHTARLIRWALEGYINSVERECREEGLRDVPVDDMMDEFDIYVDIIRRAFT